MPGRQALRELVLFAGVGVVNTVLGLGTIWIASRLGAGPYLANVIGYAVGLTNSFVMNRAITFRARAGAPGASLRFLATFAVAYMVNLGVLSIGLAIDETRAFLWQIVAMCVYTGVFFVLSKWFVFR